MCQCAGFANSEIGRQGRITILRLQRLSEMPLYEASGMKALWTLVLVFGIAHAETLTGYVVAISDGDTVTVLDDRHQQHKIRLAGIDAPEKAQAFGERSKQNLA